MADTQDPDLNYQQCFVAFLDILGFQSKVMNAADGSEKLRSLINALKISGGFPSGGKKVSRGDGDLRTIHVQTRFFSDTMVLFVKEDKRDLDHLFLMIRYIQDRLWEQSICLRGGITIGEMYWKDDEKDITLGPALIEAYKLESEIAIFPRIIVSDDLYKYISTKQPKTDFFSQGRQMDTLLKRDNDGSYFLDLLNPTVTRSTGERLITQTEGFAIEWDTEAESNYENIKVEVTKIIEENFQTDDVKIKQKYQWLENYLNS